MYQKYIRYCYMKLIIQSDTQVVHCKLYALHVYLGLLQAIAITLIQLHFITLRRCGGASEMPGPTIVGVS